MSTANVSRRNVSSLPEELVKAQEAINLPEVQEMLRRLSEYNLGIFMPHMHDETGLFHPLPDELMQVEDGLKVSFRPSAEIKTQEDRYLAIGWVWRGGAATPKSECFIACASDATGHHVTEHVGD